MNERTDGIDGLPGQFDMINIHEIILMHNYIHTLIEPYKAEFVCLNHGDQRVFSIRNHHKCLSLLFLLHLNTFVIGYTAITNIYILTACAWIRL